MPRPLLLFEIHPSAKVAESVKLGFGVIIEEGCEIGKNTLIGHHVVLRPFTKIGANCKIGHFCLSEGWNSVGDWVSIRPHSTIGKGALIEDKVFIGNRFAGMNDKKMSYLRNPDALPFESWMSENFELKSFVIKRGARIGVGVTVMAGVTIGENAVVGAGSLVLHDVPPRMKYCGHPAKETGFVLESEWL